MISDISVNVNRETEETQVRLVLSGANKEIDVESDLPFLDHMLEAFAFHGGLGLRLEAAGDTQVDGHHLVEDVGLCLGRAVRQAAIRQGNVKRFGGMCLPMDDALVGVYLDIGGRCFLNYELGVPARTWGRVHSDHIREFCRAFVRSGITLHVLRKAGKDPHHLVEAFFKALGKAAGEALSSGERSMPSTKGAL